MENFRENTEKHSGFATVCRRTAPTTVNLYFQALSSLTVSITIGTSIVADSGLLIASKLKESNGKSKNIHHNHRLPSRNECWNRIWAYNRGFSLINLLFFTICIRSSLEGTKILLNRSFWRTLNYLVLFKSGTSGPVSIRLLPKSFSKMHEYRNRCQRGVVKSI